jgi:hypothetical protein
MLIVRGKTDPSGEKSRAFHNAAPPIATTMTLPTAPATS